MDETYVVKCCYLLVLAERQLSITEAAMYETVTMSICSVHGDIVVFLLVTLFGQQLKDYLTIDPHCCWYFRKNLRKVK